MSNQNYKLTKKRREQLNEAQKRHFQGNKQEIYKQRIIKNINDGKPVRVITIKKYFKDHEDYEDLLDYANLIKGVDVDELVSKTAEKIKEDNKDKPKAKPPAIRTTRSSKKILIKDLYPIIENLLKQNSGKPASKGWKHSVMTKITKILNALNLDIKKEDTDIAPYLRDVENIKKLVLKLGDDNKRKKDEEAGAGTIRDYFHSIYALCYNDNIVCQALGKTVLNKYIALKSEWDKRKKIRFNKDKADGKLEAEDWSEVVKALDNVRIKAPNTQDHLIIALYNQYQIRDNYGDTLLIKGKPKDQKHNYYNIKTGMFYNYNYKTDGKEDNDEFIIELEMSNEVQDIVKTILVKQPDRKYLIQKRNGEPYIDKKTEKSGASKEVNRVFGKYGKKMGTRAIRKAFVSNPVYQSSNEYDIIEQARKMQHSVDTQYNTYLRKVKKSE